MPAGIDWKQWVGPAPKVEYSSKIAPFAWRGWWDYGTGALGDMACHIMDCGYWALMPGAPVSVLTEQNGATPLSPPINSQIMWDFAPSEYTSKEGFRYFWYDGYVDAGFDRKNWQLIRNADDYNHPDQNLLEGMDFKEFGSVIVGEEGKLFFNRDRNTWVVKSSSNIDGFEWPKPLIPRASDQNNHQEWMDAINGTIDQGQSNFSLAGPFTETILLGVLAQRVPDERLEWDAENLEVKGRPDLKQYIQRDYQNGWTIPV